MTAASEVPTAVRPSTWIAAPIGPEPAVATPLVVVAADADFLGVTGWIETKRPSQIIRFGAYRQDVKKRRNWPTVSFVFGFMS